MSEGELSTHLIEDIPSGRHSEEFDRVQEARRKRYWNFLVKFVPKSGYKPPQGRLAQVLELACGSGDQATVLTSYFGGSDFEVPNNGAEYTGIDLYERAIKSAQERYEVHERIKFVYGDATSLDQYPEIPAQADVVVIRHPHLTAGRENWQRIFEQAVQRLTPEGIIVLTTFSRGEQLEALDIFKDLQAKPVFSGGNPYSDFLSPAALDSFASILTKS